MFDVRSEPLLGLAALHAHITRQPTHLDRSGRSLHHLHARRDVRQVRTPHSEKLTYWLAIGLLIRVRFYCFLSVVQLSDKMSFVLPNQAEQQPPSRRSNRLANDALM